MTAVVVQSKHNGGLSLETIAVTFDTTPTVGNAVIVMAMSSSNPPPVLSVTDNQGNSYQRDVEVRDQFLAGALSARVNVASGAFTVTLASTGTSDLFVCYILEVSGLDLTLDVVQHNGATSGAYDTLTSAATIYADELVIAACFPNSLGATPVPENAPPYIDIGPDSSFLVNDCVYKVVSATGTQRETWTGSGGITTYQALLVTYKVTDPPFMMSSVS